MAASRPVRLFVGKLATGTKSEEIEDVFSKYGKVTRIDLKGGYAFLFYEEQSSAEDAIAGLNGVEINGSAIVCEFAKSSRDNNGPSSKPKSDYRVTITHINSRTSWQDLKDWARVAGNVSYTNVFFKDGQKAGTVEYESAEDLEKALRILEESPLHGDRNHRVVREDPADRHDEDRGGGGYSRSHDDRGSYGRGGPQSFSRDSRGGGGYQDDHRSGGYSRGGTGGASYERGGADPRGAYSGRGGYSDDRARGPAEPAYYRDSRPPLRSRSRDRVAPRDRSRERDRERDRGYAPAPAYDSRGPPSDYGYAYPPRGGGGGGGGYPAESRRDYDRGAREYPSRGGYDAREPAYEERRYDRR